MKKIVALVLSLVMVLGLATTAFAEIVVSDAVYDLHQADAKGSMTYDDWADVSYTFVPGAKDEATGGGMVAHYEILGYTFVKIDKADATVNDFYLTKANEKTPLFYLSVVEDDAVFYEVEAKEFDDFGVKCGQLNVPYAFTVAELGFYSFTNPVTGAMTLFVDYDDEFTYDSAAPYFNGMTVGDDTQVLVDGEVVPVLVIGEWDAGVFALNQHVWAPVAYDKTTPVEALCGLCGAKADVYKPGKAPAGSIVLPAEFGNDEYELVIKTAGTGAPEAGDKVESAETFDAGIAMYVGMSVMAAAGSAVVLKKKD